MQKQFMRAVVCALVSIASYIYVQPVSGATWGADYFPNVPLVTQDGKTVHFYDDLLKGKRFIINLMYTECGDSCPLETARLSQVTKILGDHLGRDIFFYSLSIDPNRDTPAQLKAYAQKFHARPGWLFLTGGKADVELIRRKLGLQARADENELTAHSTSIMIGNEPTGEWIKDSSMDNPQYIATIVRDWLSHDAGGKPVPSYAQAPALPSYVADKGGYLFHNRCAACHTLGEGDSIGPDLRGVTQRRDRAWLARFIAAPNELITQKDPTALALYKTYGQVKMPNLRLSDVDIKALLGYLDAPTPSATAAPCPAKRYTLHGRVVALSAQSHTATIAGEAVNGWMGAMTMKYPVPNEKDWQSLHEQQRLTATVEVRENGDYTLSDVKAPHPPESAAKGPVAQTAK